MGPYNLATGERVKPLRRQVRDPQLLRGGKVLFYFVVVFELCRGDIIAAINTLPSTKIGLKIALRVSCF